MKITNTSPCPCGSLTKYKKCCKIFHNGKTCKSSLELMKSRYCAFSVKEYSYIIKTTHILNSDYTSHMEEWKDSILEFCNTTSFKSLEILDYEEGIEVSFVTFKANLSQNNQDVSFTEKSRFEKVNGLWLYHSGVFL